MKTLAQIQDLLTPTLQAQEGKRKPKPEEAEPVPTESPESQPEEGK